MKKLVLSSVLVVIAAGGIFAQEKYDGSKKNAFFFGPIMTGYERDLNHSFSVGAEVGINFLAIETPTWGTGIRVMPSFADAFARWYPWQKIFFVNLGLGYQGGGMGMETPEGTTIGGFHIKPQIGWKIDIGNAGGWFFETRAGFGVTVGGDVALMTLTVPVLFGIMF